MPGKLYLVPTLISDSQVNEVIPNHITGIINSIRVYIVENERTARRMLIQMGLETAIDDLEFLLLNKHTAESDIPDFLAAAENEDIGLLSEAGVPAIADPGSSVVQLAHEKGIEVVPLVGPSSILLAMMASGMNGQNFSFSGYLPVKPPERIRKIKQLEQRSLTENQSQIFIEAPYRNNQLLRDILAHCNESSRLCIACNLTASIGWAKTKTIRHWKKGVPDLHKQPTIFILHRS